MKQFGDVVSVVRGLETVNALVAQAVQQPDGLHLTVISLDPNKESSVMSGQNVSAAVLTDFVTPLSPGKTYGWTDRDESAVAAENEELKQSVADGQAKILEMSNQIVALQQKTVGGATQVDAAAGTDFESALHKAAETINQQSDLINTQRSTIAAQAEEITSLHAKLAEVEAELKNTTEGIDKQLQAIADENAVKTQEAAPEATPDPTENSQTSAKQEDSEIPSVSGLDSDSSEPGSTSDNPLPG
jgi:hypothetical protein